MNIKKLAYLLIIILFFSCNKKDESIPTYLKIDEIIVDEGNSTSNITDAWVYINDQLQGVYELPAQFPVLENGTKTVRVKAGIKNNGISSSRIYYPFYSSYFEDIDFSENSIIQINPSTNYLGSAQFFIEDFEGVGINLNETEISDTSIIKLNENNNNFGKAILSDSLFTFEVATDELTNLPQAGAPVFLELDYKSNTQFLVGVFVNYPQQVIAKDLIWITPKEDWNKIYINLTSTISESINATSFKVFLGMKRDFSLEKNEMYIDNLKVVY